MSVAYQIFTQPSQQALDTAASVLAGATLTFSLTGTSTPTNAYSDAGLTTPVANPLSADSAGVWAPIFLDPAVSYRIVLKTLGGSTLQTWDPANESVLTSVSFNALYFLTDGHKITPAETAAGVTVVNYAYLPGNMLRYGLVANNTGSTIIAANTAIIAALLNPLITAGPIGQFVFPNRSGADIYTFNDLFAMRDGCKLDLQGCTLSFVKSASTGNESVAGFITFVRDCEIKNGSISVSYTGGANKGACICIGARGSEVGSGAFFPNTYDASLGSPQGNCRLQNLRLTTNNPLGLHVQLIGGLQNTVLEEIYMNGQGVADGIDYEFGWATSGTTNLRQTAHAHNLTFRNIIFTNGNLTLSSAGALTIAGAYSVTIDGLYADQTASLLTVTTGESLNYRPWDPVDVVGVKHNVYARNLVGSRLSQTGISLSGAQLGSGGYLSAIIAALGHPADYIAQTDLYSFDIGNFVLDGSSNAANGYGVFILGARHISLTQGLITPGFQRGIVATDETVSFIFDGMDIFGCTQEGMQLDIGSAIWSPARLKKGTIRNCYIAGNGSSSAGAFAGVEIGNCDSVAIEDNRFGYELTFQGLAEPYQAPAVLCTSTASNVICDRNRVAVQSGVAYANAVSTTSNGNEIRNATGVRTVSGAWEFNGTGVATSTAIGAVANAINTTGKYFGRQVYDSSNKRIMVAQGPAAADQWEVADGSAAVTPA